ncbi:TPA: phage tail assembly chaperone [Escherichia coli]|uniref:phage tail assembly chaperone n=1 Tax=Enterobacteriaceae TaxID=543 RepID=UPI0017970DF0|nr:MULTISPECIES: phage tail assembly chaperone [Enterobacteriaceae]EFH4336372.1 phage tail protein [Escherichia coli]EFO0470733.1 phage tail protein [Escherichia coli]EGP9349022.1 phage tail protein [Escherichia coli]EGQ0045339.1 phage tail protein [Escherichia coli]MBW9463241.1 phage tail protein [Kluyvera sp. EC_51]
MGKNIRELALARLSGFRNKTEVVKEWGGVGVILREPSAEAWLRWQEIVKESDEELSVSEKAMRNLRADVTLFIDVVCDENQEPVFTPEDAEEVQDVYGPVHSRLLKQALDLITSSDDAKKK